LWCCLMFAARWWRLHLLMIIISPLSKWRVLELHFKARYLLSNCYLNGVTHQRICLGNRHDFRQAFYQSQILRKFVLPRLISLYIVYCYAHHLIRKQNQGVHGKMIRRSTWCESKSWCQPSLESAKSDCKPDGLSFSFHDVSTFCSLKVISSPLLYSLQSRTT
jgi:hypothetical protein